ncbi:MAG: hypothetical protein IPG96_14615 [Proteobacteria bacterium]|nr:hypothetical protein [Pseudomonadota bacterium]
MPAGDHGPEPGSRGPSRSRSARAGTTAPAWAGSSAWRRRGARLGRLGLGLLGLGLALAAGCAHGGAAGTRLQVLWVAPPGGPHAVATHLGLPLRTGQLVLSEAPGPYRLLFGLGTRHFWRFTHSALLVLQDGEPYVYDFAGEYKPVFARSPAAGIRGGLRKTPLWDYVRAHLYVEIVDPALLPGRRQLDAARVSQRLRAIERARVPFDAAWDLTDHRAYFCTEFLAEVLGPAGAAIPALDALTDNPSLRRVLHWYGVRSARTLPAGAFYAAERRVAAFSVWSGLAEVEAYFAAKAELHRRFTPAHRVGDVFRLVGHDLAVRAPIEEFLAAARARFAGSPGAPDGAAITRVVAALAHERFGAEGL